MKKVTLFEGIESSVIGFGCAPILGAVDSKTSKIAIIQALEKGVNHFDLARSYGYGEAERFVGKLIAPIRKELVISSKFGIKANAKAKLFRPIKPLVRKLVEMKKQNGKNKSSDNKANSNAISNLFHDRIALNMVEMNKSLEESLRALKTDYLDYFFIHEPLETIINVEELIITSEKLKKSGKIRAFGIAYMQDKIDFHKDYLNQFDVLQFNNSPGIKDYEQLVVERGNKSNIFFSPLKGGDANLTAKDKLVKLHQDFPKSVILCSMFNPNHINANTELFIE
jgi:aryl-alcohol dehydrogenase-like predicted oxidoreductase